MRRTETLSAIASALASAEYLASPNDRADGGWNHWPTQRRRVVRHDHSIAALVFDSVGSERVERILHILRILGAGALILPRTPGPVRMGASIGLCLSGILLAPKHLYGSEGTDHVAIMTQALCGAARVVPNHRGTMLDALALQGALSYGMSGVGKLAGDKWRNGTALGELSEAQSYGLEPVARALRRYPRVARMATWSVVAAEIGATAAVVVPPPAAQVFVWGLRGFHLGNAAVLGLNRFVWAFAALHPSMLRASRRAYQR